MKRMFRLFGVVIVAAALLAGCDKEEDGGGPTGPGGGTGGVPDALALARTFPPLLANGVDAIPVRATVVDGQGRGLEGVGVFFTTSRGSIEPFATTDEDGVATTTLTSEASAADIAATVNALAVSDTGDVAAALRPLGASVDWSALRRLPAGATLVVSREPLGGDLLATAIDMKRDGRLAPPATLGTADAEDQAQVPMRGITVSLAATPGVIPADGQSSSRVVARLVETTSRVPLDGQEVRFGATAGTITGRVTSDATGSAEATLTGLTSGANSTITVFYGNTLTAQTNVTFSALTLTLSSVRNSISADGTSTTFVVARLVNEARNPVPGVSVNFSTTLGAVTSPVVTDAAGEARSTLRSGATTGTATVTATFAGNSAQTTVNFVAPPVPQSIVLTVTPTNIPADGASRAVVTAEVLDAQGAPMPDGTAVTFSIVSGGGTLIGPNAVVEGGEASAEYVAGTAPGLVQLRAAAGTVNRTVQMTLSPLDAGGLTLTSGAPSVLADGLTSTILTATVRDDFGNPVAAGTAVSFQTTLGVLEGATPTDAAGVATVRLRAGRFETGIARVTASVGSLARTVDVAFVSDAADHIVLLELDNPSIGVAGTGSPQTATLTFEVRDRHGIPVDAGHAANVTFTIVPTGGATDAALGAAAATTNERGRVNAVVRSGAVSGTVEVRAAIGGIVSQPIRVAVHGDLPDPDHFSLSFERVNIAGLVFDGIRNGVTARVGDQHGNPVPDSTVVWFEAEYGLIQGSAFTDEHAEATVWEITAAPRPLIPGGDGLVTITAQTIAKNGQYITTSGDVMWSGPSILEITSPAPGFAVPSGGSITINFRVRDANNNPLTAGTTISAEATEGDLGGQTNFVLPDTQSESYTFFSVTLTDNDTEETDPPLSTTVTINVASQNGNVQVSITGTID
jgi:adhesin/invasin